MPAPAIGAVVVKGGKIVVKLAAVFTAIYLTKKEIDEILQDATPMMCEIKDLPSKNERDISAVYPETKALFDMAKDIFKGDYRPEDPLAILMAVLSIGYLISPCERPESMQTDDIKTLSYAAGVCAKELKRYMEMKGIEPQGYVDKVINEDPYKSPNQ
jgi:hypothetical protein